MYKFWNNGGGAVIRLNKATHTWSDATATWANLADARGAEAASISVGTQINVWDNFTVTGAVAGFVANPASNYGFIITSNGPDGGGWRSADYATQSQRPKLTVYYRTSLQAATAPAITPASGVYDDSVTVAMSATGTGAQIRYTLDGTDPSAASTLYSAPFKVHSNTGKTVKARSFVTGMDESAITTNTYRVYLRSTTVPSPLVGLKYYFYGPVASRLPDFASMTVRDSGTVSSIDISAWSTRTNFAVQFIGYLNVPSDGVYTFTVDSDDGSRLFLDGVMVVDNDSNRIGFTSTGMVALKAGRHAMILQYMQGTYGMHLNMSYQVGSGASTTVGASMLSYQSSQSPVGVALRANIAHNTPVLPRVFVSGMGAAAPAGTHYGLDGRAVRQTRAARASHGVYLIGAVR